MSEKASLFVLQLCFAVLSPRSCTKGTAPRNFCRSWLPSSRTICLSGRWWPLPPAWYAATLRALSPESPPSTGTKTITTKPSWASTAAELRATTRTTTAQVSKPDTGGLVWQTLKRALFGYQAFGFTFGLGPCVLRLEQWCCCIFFNCRNSTLTPLIRFVLNHFNYLCKGVCKGIYPPKGPMSNIYRELKYTTFFFCKTVESK